MNGLSPESKKYLGWGLLTVGLGAAAYYAWMLSTSSDKISLKSSQLWGWQNGKVKLRLVFFNYAQINLPFEGFKGAINLRLNEGATNAVNLGQIDVPPQGNLLAQEDKEIYVEIKPNWFAVAALVPNIVAIATGGDILQELAKYYVEIEGKLFFNYGLSADIKQRVG
jgi:hypothetical protein